MVTPITGGSYLDYLLEGEELPRSVVDVCAQMEQCGWRVQKRDARGLRYWCSCERQHQTYIDLEGILEERLEFLQRKTCLTF
jgi:hypothetical protein